MYPKVLIVYRVLHSYPTRPLFRSVDVLQLLGGWATAFAIEAVDGQPGFLVLAVADLRVQLAADTVFGASWTRRLDRKGTRLNSSHTVIKYAAIFMKKKRIVSMALQ